MNVLPRQGNRLTANPILSLLAILALPASMIATGCGSTSAASTTTTTSTTGTANAYTAVYKSLTWGSNVTVTYPTTCTMSVTSTGVPSSHNAYYLAPASTTYPTVVATTASGLQLAVTPYTPASIASGSATFNICPTTATSTTSTSQGPIGFITSGEFLYNAYEATSTPALGDNVSYSFTSNGTMYTASFIDSCNSHPTPISMSYTWHYHGVPTCYTATVDGASGPSHIIGIALDGFPIYGGRDISGNIITTSQLDACNGITSVTPEFSTATYHYVLPIGVTNKYSSMNCYVGTVSTTVMAEMRKLGCRMMDGKYNKQHPKEIKKEEMMKMGV
jgi:hypothetical protein